MCPPYGHGPFHRPSFLVARHLWDQVVAVVQLPCQFRKLGTIPNEVGTHGDAHINGGVFIIDGLHQQVHKGKGFVYGAGVCAVFETEQFFKLVDQYKVVGVPGLPGLLYGLHQAQ